jgi:hypothetical protein
LIFMEYGLETDLSFFFSVSFFIFF